MAKESRALRPDAQAFDQIHITTVPRFKTSGLSGDEWRISAKVELFRKGRMLHENSFRDVETAIAYLRAVWDDAEGRYFAGEGDFCDQEGCSATATVTYRVKNRYCNEPYSHKPIPCDGEKSHLGAKDVVTVRKFCAHHSKRGDAAFDDSDANYELISG